jgi:hypothetical protein
MLVHPWRLAAKDPLGLLPPEGRRARPPVIPLNEPFLGAHLTPLELPRYGGPAEQLDRGFLLNERKAGLGSYLFADAYADVWRPRLRELVLARFEAQVGRISARHGVEAPTLVVKEPNSSHGAELLMSLFPRSRLLFLVRDGRDVVDSAMDLRRHGALRDPIVDTHEGRLRFVLDHARLWVARTAAVERAYAAHPKGLRTMVRYEDLLEDPVPTLRQLGEWMGVERSGDELAAAVEANRFEPNQGTGPGNARRAARPGLWRENLTSVEQDVAAEIMGAKLAELGYPV